MQLLSSNLKMDNIWFTRNSKYTRLLRQLDGHYAKSWTIISSHFFKNLGILDAALKISDRGHDLDCYVNEYVMPEFGWYGRNVDDTLMRIRHAWELNHEDESAVQDALYRHHQNIYHHLYRALSPWAKVKYDVEFRLFKWFAPLQPKRPKYKDGTATPGWCIMHSNSNKYIWKEQLNEAES